MALPLRARVVMSQVGWYLWDAQTPRLVDMEAAAVSGVDLACYSHALPIYIIDRAVESS